MIPRQLTAILLKRLRQSPAVALLGSRQVGKTTLAKALDWGKSAHYLDLERPSDLAKLTDPELYLSSFANQLVILDEVQRLPDLFPVLRSLIDERRRAGEKAGQFLLLGSASPELLEQSSETLAGRISYLELTPLQVVELPDPAASMTTLWERGGYPESFLAADEETSLQWREDFITSYVERYLPQQSINATPILLRRFCSMLAHQQGATINLSKLAGSLGIDGKTARRYLDLLEGLYLVRSLPPWTRNAGKRLVKSPKVYWRDSGILHRLAGLPSLEHVLGHPLCGASWEGFCLEQILTCLPKDTTASHYRTHAGAEVDLVIERSNGEILAIEIKRTLSPKLTPGLLESMETLQADRGVIVIPEGEAYPLSKTVSAQGLLSFLQTIA
ncbi:MAG: ATP-binding protein [Verrucomicrobia bacterium]|nr:MAG: ATP-binding protein [Verrucomicrobiota bacterium]TAE86454.1 MAG: ATP-binding protein [Verrucomicrobiota bacterium]TAF23947.1 MAG: ATP-binding protein [Verrucomicrobiota bacterium]